MRCVVFGRSNYGRLIFDLLQQTKIQAGVDYKKISMIFGDISLCRCPLDEIFVIPKSPPKVPFKKAPAEIYQRYAGETSKAHNRRVRENFYGGDVQTCKLVPRRQKRRLSTRSSTATANKDGLK